MGTEAQPGSAAMTLKATHSVPRASLWALGCGHGAGQFRSLPSRAFLREQCLLRAALQFRVRFQERLPKTRPMAVGKVMTASQAGLRGGGETVPGRHAQRAACPPGPVRLHLQLFFSRKKGRADLFLLMRPVLCPGSPGELTHGVGLYPKICA